MVIKKGIKYSYVINILFVAIIFILCLWNIGLLERVRVVDDEFCYWGIAATLSGYDWTDLIAQSQYYSYGYSFILIPLFWLNRAGLAMITIYKLAVVLNAFFLSGTYFLTQYILKKLFDDIPDKMKPIISLCITLYIGNSSNMGLAWTETFLCFMFWCVVVLLYKVITKPGYGNLFGLVAASSWLVAIHMRAVGVVIAVGMLLACFFVANRKQINKKYIIYTFCMALLFGGLVVLMKGYVSNQIYLGNAGNSTNNVSANIARVGVIFSLKGIVDLAISVVGKLFYISSATFLLAIIGAFAAVFGIVYRCKKKMWQFKDWMTLFILLSFLAEVGIEAIFKCASLLRNSGIGGGRDDTLTYGRYADFVLGPMLLLGIWAVYHLKSHYYEILLSLVLEICSTGVVQLCYNVLTFRRGTDFVSFRFTASPWLVMVADNHKKDFACYVMLLSVGVLLVICLIRLLSMSKWHIFASMLVIVAGVWGILGVWGEADYTMAKREKAKLVDTVARIVEVTDKDTPVYYMMGRTNTEVKILQWILADRSIQTHPADKIEDIDRSGAIILVNSDDAEIASKMREQFDFLYDSGTLSVFVDIQNKHYEALCEKSMEMAHVTDPSTRSIPLADVVTEYSYTNMNGNMYYNYQGTDGGYMTKGMAVELRDGTYEFDIDMRIRDCEANTDIGYITVGDADGDIQYTHILKADDFIEKERQTVQVSVKVKDWKEPVVGIYTYGQATIKVFDISYRKSDGCMLLDSEEMVNIAAFIAEQDAKKVYYLDSDNSGLTGFPYWEYGRLKYLPGQMLKFMDGFEDAYYIVEKTNERILDNCKSNMQELLETESYVVFLHE